MTRTNPWDFYLGRPAPSPAPVEFDPEGLAAMLSRLPDSPEAAVVANQVKVGAHLDPIEVFSLFPEAAPEGFTSDLSAAARMEAKIAVVARSTGFDPTADISPEFLTAATEAERFRDRWESTLAGVLARHWNRRRAAMLAKVRSVQFRRGTPLWDPPGHTPLIGRLDMLVDLELWDRELTEDITSALGDLQQEAAARLGAVVVESKALDLPAFIANWVRHSLSFNRSAADAVRRVLSEDPETVEDLTDRIDDHIDSTMSIVGDQVASSLATGAINEAQHDAALSANVGEKIWFSAQDGRVRPTHRHINLQRVPINRKFKVRDRKGVMHSMMHPGDITAPPDLWMNCRCLPGTVTVSANVTAAMVRPYRGVLIKMVTAGGHELSATPEHPVLTRRGWVLAGALDPSDELFCRVGADGTDTGPDVGDSPPTIEQVFDALSLAGAGREGAHVRGVHLDGDTPDGEVQVVRADGVLSFGPDAELLQELGELGVTGPHRKVSLTADESALDWITHPDTGGLTSSPHGEAKVRQAQQDGTPLDVEFPGNGENGPSSVVPGLDRVEQFSTSPAGTESDPFRATPQHSEGLQVTVDRRDPSTGDVRHFSEALAGRVEAFPLVHLSAVDWVGHVYDLSTSEQAFLAGGIITHNCVMLFPTPLSGRLWLRTDGSPIDPYGRASLARLSGKAEAVPAHHLGLTWAE